MKKSILIIVISLLCIENAFSQLKRVHVNLNGDLEIIIGVDNGEVTIDNTGRIIDVDIDGEIEYYILGYKDGNLKRIGSTSFDYYTLGFRIGKLERINETYIDYYTTGPRAGKIESIGDIQFDYYLTGPREGKIGKIGNTDIDYYTLGRRAGKIEKIGNQTYDYFMIGSRIDKLQSGNRTVTDSEIVFKLKGGF